MTNKTYLEPAAELPVQEECDILVVGGGAAGHSAAIAAAGQGPKTSSCWSATAIWAAM